LTKVKINKHNVNLKNIQNIDNSVFNCSKLTIDCTNNSNVLVTNTSFKANSIQILTNGNGNSAGLIIHNSIFYTNQIDNDRNCVICDSNKDKNMLNYKGEIYYICSNCIEKHLQTLLVALKL